MRGITAVTFANDLGSTPARANLKTGQLWLNKPMWDLMPFEHRMYVLLHEEGHIVLNTKNELEADAYASKRYLESGYKISESIRALANLLTFTSREHSKRAYYQALRAYHYDCSKNKNPIACFLKNRI